MLSLKLFDCFLLGKHITKSEGEWSRGGEAVWVNKYLYVQLHTTIIVRDVGCRGSGGIRWDKMDEFENLNAPALELRKIYH